MMDTFDKASESRSAKTLASQLKAARKKRSGSSRAGKATLPEFMLYPTCISVRGERGTASVHPRLLAPFPARLVDIVTSWHVVNGGSAMNRDTSGMREEPRATAVWTLAHEGCSVGEEREAVERKERNVREGGAVVRAEGRAGS